MTSSSLESVGGLFCFMFLGKAANVKLLFFIMGVTLKTSICNKLVTFKCVNTIRFNSNIEDDCCVCGDDA